MKTIYLAGGCFWGVQKFFDQFDGVISTEVGYANGPDAAPSYRDVCKSSGHAETVKIIYDESVISLTELLKFYFMVIDAEAKAVYEAEEKTAGAKLAVELEPLVNFFSAEGYHQKYLVKNPGGYCHIPWSMFNLKK